MKRLTLLLACLLPTLTGPALAHDLQYTVSNGEAVVVRLLEDNTPFTFEGYEVYREGEKLPYQTGRTDSQGRIAFLPDRAGKWRIRTFSEDGHGMDFSLSTDAAARIESSDKPFYERHDRIIVGIGVILGLFGFLSLYARKNKT